MQFVHLVFSHTRPLALSTFSEASTGYWHCLHSMQSMYTKLLSVHTSVCLSIHPFAHYSGGFAAVGPAARRYHSTAAWLALSSKYEQCHIVSWCRKLNTDLSKMHRFLVFSFSSYAYGAYAWFFATPVTCNVVCSVFVCGELCKYGWTDRDAIWWQTHMVPRYLALDVVQIPRRKGHFWRGACAGFIVSWRCKLLNCKKISDDIFLWVL